MRNHAQPYNALKVIGLLSLLALAAIGLSQCRMVDDTVTGVNLRANGSLSGRGTCAHKCNEDYKAAKDRESIRHKEAKRDCGRDTVCKKLESERHKEISERLKDEKKECKKTCYNEGSGQGGR